LDIVKKYPVKLFEIEPNDFSHSGTRNYGVSLAKGQFIVFTVQDARLAERTIIENALKYFNDKDVVAVGGMQTVPHEDEKNPLQWYRPQSANSVQKVKFEKAIFSKIPLNEQYNYVHLDDVIAIYRREALLQLPFPTVDFAEDIFWAKEALNNGWAIVYDNSLIAWHYHHYDDLKKLKKRIEYQNKVLKYFHISKKIDLYGFFRIFYLIFIKKGFVKKRKIYWLRYNLNLWFYKNLF
jgi:rhamnosyltransferase